MIIATRHHDFSYGHRVVGHESKCQWLHGHNGRVHFTCRATQLDEPLDTVGRVIDFSAIKVTLCAWLEEHWDHKFLAWQEDAEMHGILRQAWRHEKLLGSSIIWVPFNPTAENMARHLIDVVGPLVLPSAITLIKVTVEETRKCSATADKE